jgi:predicted site-specific integrase-resolvase
MAYIPLRKAVEFLGLHPNTLRKYADEGKIKSIKNEAGQRLYDVESYQRGATVATIVCYCRVSSTKQRDDLARQVEFMRERYPGAEIVQDIGSGLNFKRKVRFV